MFRGRALVGGDRFELSDIHEPFDLRNTCALLCSFKKQRTMLQLQSAGSVWYFCVAKPPLFQGTICSFDELMDLLHDNIHSDSLGLVTM